MYLSLLLLFFFTTSLAFSSVPPHHHQDHFIKSIPPHSLHHHTPEEYLELTHPLPSDHLTPSCSLLALHHNFGNTVGHPPVSVPYSPPSHCAWSHVALQIRASCKGEQYDRIAAVWLAGAEVLRTSTAEPTDSGIFWKVRKDVTRYSSLLVQSNLTLTVMLENVVNDVFTGVYLVDVTFFYYKVNGGRASLSGIACHQKQNKKKLGIANDDETESKLGFESEEFVKNPIIVHKEGIDGSVYHQKNSLNLYETPADLIIPISGIRDEGFWFRIESESDVHFKGIRIPPNTRKAVLEVYVSFHGNDEFWYSNPPDSYIRMNNLTTGRGHGAYREVFVMIDGSFVGSVVPFPVIFTGGINPLFWEPVVAIGAFDLPSYDLDLTPFLGLLLDRKTHFFGLGVAESIPFWLVDANLHLWLEHESTKVQAKAVDYHTPSLSVKRSSVFKQLDGSFKIKARRKSLFVGWVISAAGNLTTHVLHEFKFRNMITFHKNGTHKVVKQRVKAKTEVRVESDTGNVITRAIVSRRYPLSITTAILPGSKTDAYLMITNVSHSLRERSSNGGVSSSVINSQDSNGWMVVKDHSVLSGTANTSQIYNYKTEFGCYSRIVAVANGKLFKDNTSFACLSYF